jgi:hypothetical protein
LLRRVELALLAQHETQKIERPSDLDLPVGRSAAPDGKRSLDESPRTISHAQAEVCTAHLEQHLRARIRLAGKLAIDAHGAAIKDLARRQPTAATSIRIRGSKESSQEARDLLRAVTLDCNARGLPANPNRLNCRHYTERDKQQSHARRGRDPDAVPPDEFSSA